MTDESIMEAVKSGDLELMATLFERYHRRIFNFLARMTMDRDVAEDLTQNVFLRIIKYRGSYREGLKFQSWIYQMARNGFADYYQEQKKNFKHHIDVDKAANHIAESSEASEQEQREALLHRSLAMLDEEQRELLVLTRFEHMKYEEVAMIMETTVANIKVKVHRAIARLREHYFELEKI